MRRPALRYVSVEPSILALSPARSSSPSLYESPPKVILSALALTSLWIGQRASAYSSSAAVRGGRGGARTGRAVRAIAVDVEISRTVASATMPRRPRRTRPNTTILTGGRLRDDGAAGGVRSVV